MRGPFGSCWPVEEALGNDVIIVAGGIGLAPLRPVYIFCWQIGSGMAKSSCSMGHAPLRISSIVVSSNAGVGALTSMQVTVDSSKGEWSGHVGVVTRLIS